MVLPEADAALGGAVVVHVHPDAAAPARSERAGPVQRCGARLAVVVDRDDVVERAGQGLALESRAADAEAAGAVVREARARVGAQAARVRERVDADG